jgi:hypothetical protein
MEPKSVKKVIKLYKSENKMLPYGWTTQTSHQKEANQLYRLSYFMTGFLVCEKMQVIDFKRELKLIKWLLSQNVSIKLKCSEFYSKEEHKNSFYNLKIYLIDDDYNLIDRFFYVDHLKGDRKGWLKVSHVFDGIKKPIRYVIFYHAGQDTQYFSGVFGTKITNGSVKFVI